MAGTDPGILGPPAVTGVAATVLLKVAQVFPSAPLKRSSPPAVNTGQLKVDQARPPTFEDKDVGLLVKIVVADPPAVQFKGEVVQEVEEVPGEGRRPVERLSLEPGAQQHLPPARNAAICIGQDGQGLDLGQARNGPHALKGGQSAALPPHQATGEPTGEGHPATTGHPTDEASLRALNELDQPEDIPFQNPDDAPALHAAYRTAP